MAKVSQLQLSVDHGKLVAQVGRKRRMLSYEQAFALGHSLLEAGHHRQAEGVFAIWARVRGRGPSARLMLAKCKAETSNFEACEQMLQTVFEGETGPVAEELQSAFVFHTMGLREDAIREMSK